MMAVIYHNREVVVDRCGIVCVVLDWWGSSWAELAMALPSLSGWVPALLPHSSQPH